MASPTSIVVDCLGLTASPTGESWLVLSEGQAFPLTPPFTQVRVKVKSGARLITSPFSRGLFSLAKTPTVEWVNRHNQQLEKLFWALPIPYLEGPPPVLYMHSAGKEQTQLLLDTLKELSIYNNNFQPVSKHWVNLSRRDNPQLRYQGVNLGLVTCWGVTVDEQEAMRFIEREARRVPILWISEDPYLIKSKEGTRVQAEEFLEAARDVLSSAGFNPYNLLRYWAMQNFEWVQFGVPQNLKFMTVT